MAYALSPGVTILEKDYTSIVPSVDASTGAFAGTFPWGPVLQPVLLSSENDLVSQFGKPSASNFESFFTAANFLSYTQSLYVCRQDSLNAINAVGNLDSNQNTPGTAVKINNLDAYNTTYSGGTNTSRWAAKYKGTYGNSLRISSADSATYYNAFASGTGAVTSGNTTLTGTNTKFLTELKVGSIIYNPGSAAIGTVTGITSDTIATITAAAVTLNGAFFTGTNNAAEGTYIVALGATALTGTSTKFLTELHIGAIIKNITNTVVGTVTGITSDTVATITPATVALNGFVAIDWAYHDQFDSAPNTSSYALSANATNDELHIIVIDEDGVFTGTAGTVLEKFAFVSKASDARKYDGTNNYYKDVINNTSKYIWWMAHTANVTTSGTAWGNAAAGVTFKSLVGGMSTPLSGGLDDSADTNGGYAQSAWLLYLDDSQYDIRLLPIGKATSVTANYIIQNVAEVRKDCLVFVSPQDNAATTPIIGNGSTATTAVSTYRNAITSSSFAVMDTGYKYQYDRYNDVYRWVPLNGDIAGLCARTDYTNDAWWSPGGFSRGQIKNVVKLAVNPTKTDRDVLYKNGVNPVVAFPGQGVILYGDKTLLAKPSAFDRIGVRRLFITIEKAIGKASQYQLFEFNDAFTRAQFKNIVEPFLRDVKGRRGITDFKVVCDDTNNTGAVIDSNNFVGDIYVKPNRSINFITLSFIASRTGVDFSVVGA